MILDETPLEFHRRPRVAALLDQDVQHRVFVVDHPPEILAATSDTHHHLVEMPPTSERTLAPVEVGYDQPADIVARRRAASRLTGMPRWNISSSTWRMLRGSGGIATRRTGSGPAGTGAA